MFTTIRLRTRRTRDQPGRCPACPAAAGPALPGCRTCWGSCQVPLPLRGSPAAGPGTPHPLHLQPLPRQPEASCAPLAGNPNSLEALSKSVRPRSPWGEPAWNSLRPDTRPAPTAHPHTARRSPPPSALQHRGPLPSAPLPPGLGLSMAPHPARGPLGTGVGGGGGSGVCQHQTPRCGLGSAPSAPHEGRF